MVMVADVGTDLIDGHPPRKVKGDPANLVADVGTDLIDGHPQMPGVVLSGALVADVGTDLIDGHLGAGSPANPPALLPTLELT